MWTQPEPSTLHVKVRYNQSATDRRLVEKDATLLFDDNAHKLTVKNEHHPLE